MPTLPNNPKGPDGAEGQRGQKAGLHAHAWLIGQGQQGGKSKGAQSVESKGQGLCHRNSRNNEAWVNIISNLGLLLKWALFKKRDMHTQLEMTQQ